MKNKIAIIDTGLRSEDLTDLAQKLVENNFYVDYFCTTRPSKNVKGVEVFEIKNQDQFSSLFKESSYDAGFSAKSSKLTNPFSGIKNLPVVELSTELVSVDHSSNVVKTICKSFPEALAWIKAGGSPSKLHVVLSSNNDQVGPENLRSDLGLPEGVFVFGSYNPNQNLNFSMVPVECFLELERMGLNVAFLTLDADEQYVEVVRNSGIKHYYHLQSKNNTSFIDKFFSTLNVYVHGLRFDSVDNVDLLEAMKHGLPVVSHFTQNNYHLSIVQDAGIVHGNTDCYTFEMYNLYKNNKFYNWKRNVSRDRFVKLYSKEGNLNQYIDIVSDVAKNNKENKYAEWQTSNSTDDWMNDWMA